MRIRDSSPPYAVIHYKKGKTNFDAAPHAVWLRSVVWNKVLNRPVCISPRKALRGIPSAGVNLTLETFVDGTMINVFWNEKIGLTGGWEIATRNTVGANSSFYKSSKTKTFREMFLEAAKENNLVLERLNPKYCYSFVLQHPDNRIVVPFHKSQLYLVAMYHIDNSDKNNIIINSINNTTIRNLDWQNSTIKFPDIYSFENYSELIEKYASMNTPYNILGVVLYNSVTGERCKIRNPVYEQVRNLRGNQPKLQYQYLSLRKEGKVKEESTDRGAA